MKTLREVLECISDRETVDIRDKYGIELDGGYGNAQDVYDSRAQFLDAKVNFIQANKVGVIGIILAI